MFNRKLFNLFAVLFLGSILWLLCPILNSHALGYESSHSSLQDQVIEIIRNNPQVIIDTLEDYEFQQQEQAKKEKQKIINEIARDSKKFIGDSPILGKANAKINIIEFSDFQCPYCKDFHLTLEQFMKKHPDDISVVYKHLPLTSIHPQSMEAAKASWAAQNQNKFWQYHDSLFELSDSFNEDTFIHIAKNLDLDLSQFNNDRRSEFANQVINKDLILSDELDIEGIPFLIINGKIFEGSISLSELENLF